MSFSYRLPRLRNWLTWYADGYTDDQFSPIAYADRSAWQSGLYLSHVPWLNKMDLRAEGVYTDVPPGGGPIRRVTSISMARGEAVIRTTGILLGVGLAGAAKERRPGATIGSMPAIAFRSIFAI